MKRHSLLFGIQDYPGAGSLTPLKCPHADVDALAEVFGDPRYMGEVGQVVVCKDTTFPEAQRIFASFLTKSGARGCRHHPFLRPRRPRRGR